MTDKRKAPELVRGLGVWSATAVVIGGTIGTGIFLVPSEIARDVSSVARVMAAWIVGGIVVLFGTFCYAELGAAMPQAWGRALVVQSHLRFREHVCNRLMVQPALAPRVTGNPCTIPLWKASDYSPLTGPAAQNVGVSIESGSGFLNKF